MTARPTLADLAPKYQAQIAAQILPQATREAAQQEAHKSTIRQRRGMPSKLEMRFAAEYSADGYKHQAITLTIANGLRYTPDFYRRPVRLHGGMEAAAQCVEIKGKRRWDGSIEKLKMAAHEWPEYDFWLVTERDNGAWNWERVMP